MRQSVKITIWVSTALFLTANLLIIGFSTVSVSFGWGIGYMLGMVTVVLHLASSFFFKKYSQKEFITYYYSALLVRFFIVCALFLLILVFIKIHEFSFTVSFIISYIFHSVIEVIFLHQKLSNETSI